MTIKEEIGKILDKYNFGCVVRFRGTKTKDNISGYCKSDGSVIVINRKLRRRKDILGTLFHELGHVHCVVNGKHWNYHRIVNTKEEALAKVKAGIRAERYVDKWGEREMKKYDKRIKWVPSYFSKEDVKWFKERWSPMIMREWNNKGNKRLSNIH